jgi:hypothetical protein
VCQASGKPLPMFSEDDVMDFMVTEAITIRALEEQRDAQEKADAEREKRAWKNAIKPGRPPVTGA